MADRFAQIETELQTIGRLSVGDDVFARGTSGLIVEGQITKIVRETNFMGSSPIITVTVRTAEGYEPEFWSHQVERKG